MVFKHHIGMQVETNGWDGEKDLRGMSGILRALTDDGVHGLIEYSAFINGTDGISQAGETVGKKGHCYWQKVDYLSGKGKNTYTATEIQSDYEHRGRNLKGMPFRILGTMTTGLHVVVEFKEDIGGHSSDGLGKKGQCLCVPIDITRKEKQQAKKPHETLKAKKVGKK